MPTGISWTDEVWNPVTGCDPVSPGCDNCYAAVMANRLSKIEKTAYKYRNKFEVTTHDNVLSKPIDWEKSRKIFVNSMSDLFHHEVSDWFIDKVFTVMGMANQHTYQILTKRPERAASYFRNSKLISNIINALLIIPNLWLGVTAENQKLADKRIPQLLQIPAAIRFVSYEPLLSRIDIPVVNADQLWHWAIIGCESGPKRRPCDLDWVYSLVDQCKQSGVSVYIKQLDVNGKVVSKIEQFPNDLQIREFPK